MLDALLEGELEDPDLTECYFLEALYCSLGASLLEDGRIKFDDCIKRLASLSIAETEGVWASPGELPGRNQVSPLSAAFFGLGLSRT
jgi:dynein heavy chain